MLWWVALSLAQVTDECDAWYAREASAWDDVSAWAEAEREARPDDVRAVTTWLRSLSMRSWERDAALVARAMGWAQAHPELPDRGVVVAVAAAVAGLPEHHWMSSVEPDPGPWCDLAWEHLEEIPSGGLARLRVLDHRRWFSKLCDAPDRAPTASALAEAAADPAVPPERALKILLEDGFSPNEAAVVEAAIAADGCAIRHLAPLYARRVAGADGPRAAAMAAAEALVRSPRPSRLAAARALYVAASSDSEVAAVDARGRALDEGWPYRERVAAPAGPSEQDVAATSFDPATRLAAMDSRPPKDTWRRSMWWSERAELFQTLDQSGDALNAWAQAARAGSKDAREGFVHAALTHGARLQRAARMADAAVASARDVRSADGASPIAWRTDLADALTLRARVFEARGRRASASDDLEEAAMLDPGPSRFQAVAAVYVARGWNQNARGVLLDHVPSGGSLSEADRALLAATLEGGWAPATVDDLMTARALYAPPQEGPKDTVAEAPEGSPFPDISFRVGESERALSSFDGPVVLDLWATWCGPCKQSLPHLNELARQYAGRVTFIALSTDEEQDVADRYLKARGEVAFVSAWGGKAAQAALKVEGIPRFFVLDAAHREVATFDGYGPGSRTLDEAVEAMLAAAVRE